MISSDSEIRLPDSYSAESRSSYYQTVAIHVVSVSVRTLISGQQLPPEFAELENRFGSLGILM